MVRVCWLIRKIYAAPRLEIKKQSLSLRIGFDDMMKTYLFPLLMPC